MSREIPTTVQSIVGLPTNDPIDLYEVYLDRETLLFAATLNDVTIGTSVYSAIGLQRDSIGTTMELEVDEVAITLDNINLSFSQLVTAEPFVGRRVIIKKAFLSSSLDEASLFTMFSGRMDEPVISETTFQVRIRSELDALHHVLPRRVYSTLCNYQLYDEWCAASKTLGINIITGTVLVQSGFFTTSSTLVSSAFGINSPALADNYWAPLGTLTFKTGSNADIGREAVTHFVGSLSVEVRIPFPYSPASGDVFEIIRGCRKTPTECMTKFDNYVNYGGFPVTPKTPIV